MRARLFDWLKILLTLAFLPPVWRMPIFAMLGVTGGLALLVVRVSEAHSYLSENPRTCINCHVMVPQYATWERSSHGRDTVCTDCHLPHDSLVRKYAFKARDGMRHTTIFTARSEPQVIRASEAAKPVIRENCVRCHEKQLANTTMLTASGRSCLDCHRTVPHGEGGGLASTPNISFPHLPPVSTMPKSGDQTR